MLGATERHTLLKPNLLSLLRLVTRVQHFARCIFTGKLACIVHNHHVRFGILSVGMDPSDSILFLELFILDKSSHRLCQVKSFVKSPVYKKVDFWVPISQIMMLWDRVSGFFKSESIK